MRRHQDIPIALPLGGVDERVAQELQDPATTQIGKNVMGINPRTGRLELSQRWGLSKYVDQDFGTAIRALGSLTRNRERVDYTVKTTPTTDWTNTIPSRQLVTSLAIDPLSRTIYACSGFAGIAVYTIEGELLFHHSIDGTVTDQIVKSIQLDGFGNVYVCADRTSGSGAGYVKKFEIRETQLREVWTIQSPDITGPIKDIEINGDTIYVLQSDGGGDYTLMRYDGIFNDRPYQAWSVSETGTGGCNAVNMGPGGDLYVSCPFSYSGGFTLPGCIVKHSPMAGQKVWTAAKSNRYVGWGFHIDEDDIITTLGVDNSGSGANQNAWLARWQDLTRYDPAAGTVTAPTGVTSAGTVTSASDWEIDTGYSMDFQGVNTLDVDDEGNTYIALTDKSGSGSSSGEMVARYDFTAGSPDTVARKWLFTNSSQGGYAVKVDPRLVSVDRLSEYVVVGGEAGVSGIGQTLHRLLQLNKTISDQPARDTLLLAVESSNLDVYDVTAGSALSPSGSTGIIDTNARFVQIVEAFNQALIIDGLTIQVYDPFGDGGTNGTIEELVAAKGEIPPRTKLAAVSMGRLFVARSDTDPRNWWCSAREEFTDWQFAPVVETVNQAMAGDLSEAGKCPDIINALIPLSGDRLLMGGDRSMYVLNGDPGPGAGGFLEEVTTQTGIAFGSPWAKDERGTVYFIDTEGAIRAWNPGQLPEIISRQINERIRDIDLDDYKVTMAWNHRLETLHVWVSDYDNGTPVEHYQWERRIGAWWTVEFDDDNHHPLATHQINADGAGDRRVLLAGRDGYVREIDQDAKNDDSTAIDSEVWIGPVNIGNRREAVVFNFNAILGPDSDQLELDFYGFDQADIPDSPGTARFTASVTADRNATLTETVRGQSVYIKANAANASRAWSLQELTAQVRMSGKARVSS